MTNVPETDDDWRKSSFSSQGGDCVEIRADLEAVRDTKNSEAELNLGRRAMEELVRRLRSS